MLVVVVVLIAATGVLALSETALTRTSKAKAQALVEEKRRGAPTLLHLVERIDAVLPVVLFALELCTLVAATLVGVVSAHAFGGLGCRHRDRLRGGGDLRGGRTGPEDVGDPAHRASRPGRGPDCQRCWSRSRLWAG